MDASALSITELFYEEGSFGVFVLVTIVLGGGAAALSGRAIAETWRPWWQIVAYSFVLSAVVRFFHFSLFEGTLLSAHYYLVDSAICIAFGFLGFRAARARQMVTQYRWIYETEPPMRWRRRPASSNILATSTLPVSVEGENR